MGEEMTLSVLPRSATMLCDGVGHKGGRRGRREGRRVVGPVRVKLTFHSTINCSSMENAKKNVK